MFRFRRHLQYIWLSAHREAIPWFVTTPTMVLRPLLLMREEYEKISRLAGGTTTLWSRALNNGFMNSPSAKKSTIANENGRTERYQVSSIIILIQDPAKHQFDKPHCCNVLVTSNSFRLWLARSRQLLSLRRGIHLLRPWKHSVLIFVRLAIF